MKRSGRELSRCVVRDDVDGVPLRADAPVEPTPGRGERIAEDPESRYVAGRRLVRVDARDPHAVHVLAAVDPFAAAVLLVGLPPEQSRLVARALGAVRPDHEVSSNLFTLQLVVVFPDRVRSWVVAVVPVGPNDGVGRVVTVAFEIDEVTGSRT